MCSEKVCWIYFTVKLVPSCKKGFRTLDLEAVLKQENVAFLLSKRSFKSNWATDEAEAGRNDGPVSLRKVSEGV